MCSYTLSYLCKDGSARQTITCDGSQTVEFLPRTHFFKANPLFRISAINSEGCIDGPVSTNHSLRVPLMSNHCQPLSPQWEFQGAALLTEWDIKSTHSTSGWANHTISFSAKAAVRGIRIHNNYIFFPVGAGGGPLQQSTINTTMHWLDSPRVNIITLQLNSLIAEVRISSSPGAPAETGGKDTVGVAAAKSVSDWS